MSNKLLVGLNLALAVLIAVAATMYVNEARPPAVQVATEQPADFGQQVEDYLLSNPGVVRDALLELDRREVAAQAELQKVAIAQYSQELFNSDRDFVIGNLNGDVTMVEFFDYNCGFCRRAMADIDRLLEEDPNLRVVLKEFPVLGQGSVAAAKLSATVIDEEQFYEFHQKLMTVPGGANGESALAIARQSGFDVARMRAAAESPTVLSTLNATYQIAQDIGVTGTPSFVIGDRLLVGAVGYEALRQSIADERARLTAATN